MHGINIKHKKYVLILQLHFSATLLPSSGKCMPTFKTCLTQWLTNVLLITLRNSCSLFSKYLLLLLLLSLALQPSAGYGLLWLCSPAQAMASCGSTAQRGLWPPRSRGFLFTHDTPESVGPLWTSDHLVAETSIWQHTTDKHSCPGGIRTHEAARFRLVTAIAVSNPARGIDVSLLWVSCFVRERFSRRVDHPSRGVLKMVFGSLCVI
jgi:hypothetical protein